MAFLKSSNVLKNVEPSTSSFPWFQHSSIGLASGNPEGNHLIFIVSLFFLKNFLTLASFLWYVALSRNKTIFGYFLRSCFK